MLIYWRPPEKSFSRMARPGAGWGVVSRCKAGGCSACWPADLEKVRDATLSTQAPKLGQLGRLSFLSSELGVKPKHKLTKHRKGFSESIPPAGRGGWCPDGGRGAGLAFIPGLEVTRAPLA